MSASTAAVASVNGACLEAVLQAASALGVDREALLRDVGIDQSLLQLPLEQLPVEQFFSLYRLAEERSACPDLGLNVGKITFFMGLNLHLYMTTICRNLREYLNVIPSTLRLRGDLGQVLIRPAGEFIRLEWHPLAGTDNDRGWRCLTDEMLASSALIVGSICSLPVPVLGAELAYKRPADTAALEAAFGRELQFDCDTSCLIFSRESLRYPLVSLNYDLGVEFKAAPQSLFEGAALVDPVIRDVSQAMRRVLPSGELTIDSLSEDMGISRRTLQRRLTAHGASFKQLLQSLREELSQRYLSDPRLGITEIAFLLGYADQASFSNAFKVWRGCSPSEFRNHQ